MQMNAFILETDIPTKQLRPLSPAYSIGNQTRLQRARSHSRRARPPPPPKRAQSQTPSISQHSSLENNYTNINTNNNNNNNNNNSAFRKIHHDRDRGRDRDKSSPRGRELPPTPPIARAKKLSADECSPTSPTSPPPPRSKSQAPSKRVPGRIDTNTNTNTNNKRGTNNKSVGTSSVTTTRMAYRRVPRVVPTGNVSPYTSYGDRKRKGSKDDTEYFNVADDEIPRSPIFSRTQRIRLREQKKKREKEKEKEKGKQSAKNSTSQKTKNNNSKNNSNKNNNNNNSNNSNNTNNKDKVKPKTNRNDNNNNNNNNINNGKNITKIGKVKTPDLGALPPTPPGRGAAKSVAVTKQSDNDEDDVMAPLHKVDRSNAESPKRGRAQTLVGAFLHTRKHLPFKDRKSSDEEKRGEKGGGDNDNTNYKEQARLAREELSRKHKKVKKMKRKNLFNDSDQDSDYRLDDYGAIVDDESTPIPSNFDNNNNNNNNRKNKKGKRKNVPGLILQSSETTPVTPAESLASLTNGTNTPQSTNGTTTVTYANTDNNRLTPKSASKGFGINNNKNNKNKNNHSHKSKSTVIMPNTKLSQKKKPLALTNSKSAVPPSTNQQSHAKTSMSSNQVKRVASLASLAKRGADSQRSTIDSNFSLKNSSNINNNNNNNNHRGSLSSNGSFSRGSSEDTASNPNSRKGSRRNLINSMKKKGSADSSYTNVRPKSTSARFSRKKKKSVDNVEHKDDGINSKNSRQPPPIALPSKAAINLNNALSNNDKMYPFTPLVLSTQTSVDGDVSPVPAIRNHRMELSSTPRIIFEHDVLSAQSSIRSDSAGSHRDLLEIRGYRNFFVKLDTIPDTDDNFYNYRKKLMASNANFYDGSSSNNSDNDEKNSFFGNSNNNNNNRNGNRSRNKTPKNQKFTKKGKNKKGKGNGNKKDDTNFDFSANTLNKFRCDPNKGRYIEYPIGCEKIELIIRSCHVFINGHRRRLRGDVILTNFRLLFRLRPFVYSTQIFFGTILKVCANFVLFCLFVGCRYVVRIFDLSSFRFAVFLFLLFVFLTVKKSTKEDFTYKSKIGSKSFKTIKCRKIHIRCIGYT